MKKEIQSLNQEQKVKKLLLSIFLDLIGMLSFTIPVIGEFSDVVWAPVAAYMMTRMYKGSVGKISGVITFLEEILPFTDVIPTFTLTWLYTYVYKKSE
jgi:hypothetical protein